MWSLMCSSFSYGSQTCIYCFTLHICHPEKASLKGGKALHLSNLSPHERTILSFGLESPEDARLPSFFKSPSGDSVLVVIHWKLTWQRTQVHQTSGNSLRCEPKCMSKRELYSKWMKTSALPPVSWAGTGAICFSGFLYYFCTECVCEKRK